MRLSNKYIEVFVNTITNYLPHDSHVELRLYGSRIHDDLKGGDIDLLLITHSADLAKYLKQCKPEIFGGIFSVIDEQKIDLLIINSSAISSDPFVSKILPESILLKKWDA